MTAIQPTETTINTTDGIWTFKGYELSEIEKITEDSEFIGIWEFTENADTNMNQTNVDNGDTDNHKPNNDEKNDNNMITNVNTGDSSNLILWSIISIVSVLGILVTIIIKYKKINNH
ncbi:MAG: SHIRT domain-containing protein [Acutalibacteraceae bacterium]